MVCAVAGMSCMRPTAPAAETASSSQSDSHLMIAQTSSGSTPCRSHDSSIASAWRTG